MSNILVKILETIRPEAAWELIGETLDGLNWLDETSAKPTQAEIDAATPAAQTAVAKDAVDILRRQQYQVRSDPLFLKWQRGEASQEDWLAEVNSIRTEFPDPAS